MTSPSNAPTELSCWRIERDADATCWLALDRPDSGTNTLSRTVMQELDQALDAIAAASATGLVIWSAKPGGFVAGADINEFPAMRSAEEAAALVREGQRILARIEALPCPSVAFLNGSALGGGLELALATTWRLGLATLQGPCLGLPEVQLGLHPGFGGTVRATRLLGARRALELMLTGRAITLAEAVRWGLIDSTANLQTWRDDARALLRTPRPRRRVSPLDTLLGLAPVRSWLARSLVRQTRKKADPRHFPAPYALIELWRAHGADGAGAYEAEARSFAGLAVTPTSRNLVRAFFLKERLKRLAGRATRPAQRVHVVGAGVMGGDIAAWCAAQGLEVTLQDRELKFIEPALERAARFFARRHADDPAGLAEVQRRLRPDVNGDGLATADVVIEAIFENLEAKRALWRDVERRARADCLLATNTSSITLEDIGSILADPARLIGLHFFNPVTRLPLVEVVHAPGTRAPALQNGLAFARQIGKLPIACRSHPGFLVNRILAPYLAEALSLAQEGVPLAAIDAAATDFGIPIGPVELADTVGLDVVLHVARIMAPIIGRPVAPVLEQMVAAGHLGQKTGRGFYVYQEGRAVKPHGPTVFTPETQDRLVFALLNEAAQCLAEGIVGDADLVDAGVIFATGFAPFRGGPLQHARSVGIDAVIRRLEELTARHGVRFAPSPGWQKLRTM
ncbi:MAG: enoyl-CoA hydratase/isomerase family protein [Gammaproteobacteria bacterium]|nr:enoyl-CoA hydratase/isomerase family protein [Gammaproteobacteria bacterium]